MLIDGITSRLVKRVRFNIPNYYPKARLSSQHINLFKVPVDPTCSPFTVPEMSIGRRSGTFSARFITSRCGSILSSPGSCSTLPAPVA
jgi:hypothetical protein